MKKSRYEKILREFDSLAVQYKLQTVKSEEVIRKNDACKKKTGEELEGWHEHYFQFQRVKEQLKGQMVGMLKAAGMMKERSLANELRSRLVKIDK